MASLSCNDVPPIADLTVAELCGPCNIRSSGAVVLARQTGTTVNASDRPAGGSATRPSRGENRTQQMLWAVIFFFVLLVAIILTSAPPLAGEDLEAQEPAVLEATPAQDPEPDPPLTLPETQSDSAAPQARVSIETLADEQTGWLTITGQSTSSRGSSAVARYGSENEFDIETVNVDRFELDLSALPVNRTRRFILHVDGQDMLLFPEAIGTITFARSPEGTWEKQ